ncbi:MAG TPA: DUF1330 domain-containing protein [Pyrinomonadaceae bacterium]
MLRSWRSTGGRCSPQSSTTAGATLQSAAGRTSWRGEWRPVFPVLIEFPDLETAHRWYDSEEYRELKALRLAATKGNAVFIEGTGFRR